MRISQEKVLIFLLIMPSASWFVQASEERREIQSQSIKTQNPESKDEIAARFVGTWRLVSIEEPRPNGEITTSTGRYPVGLLIYDGTGHMAVQIVFRERPNFSSGGRQGTLEEIKAAFEGYAAYFGRYEVDGKDATVTHHVEGSPVPNNIGTVVKRAFEFSGNRLILTPPRSRLTSQQGETRLIWELVK